MMMTTITRVARRARKIKQNNNTGIVEGKGFFFLSFFPVCNWQRRDSRIHWTRPDLFLFMPFLFLFLIRIAMDTFY